MSAGIQELVTGLPKYSRRLTISLTSERDLPQNEHLIALSGVSRERIELGI